MSAILATLCPFIITAQVAGAAPVTPIGSAATAVKTIEIPEGTPVIVHFYKNLGYLDYSNTDESVNSTVLQVDSDVVINGVIVIPAGSLGLAHTDSINYSSPLSGAQYDGNYFHMLWVFSAGSTQLALDQSRVPTTLVRHQFSPDTQYTAKLMHAIVTLSK